MRSHYTRDSRDDADVGSGDQQMGKPTSDERKKAEVSFQFRFTFSTSAIASSQLSEISLSVLCMLMPFASSR